MPVYELKVFLEACASGSNVHVIEAAWQTARTHLGLQTKKDVLAFIATGLEDLTFVDNKVWRNNPDPSKPIGCDNYEFYSGTTRGYLSFFRFHTGTWAVKSLKRNKLGSERGFASQLGEKMRARLKGPT